MLPPAVVVGALCRHQCRRSLEALGVGYFNDHSKPSSLLPQVSLTARRLQLQAVTNTHPVILNHRNPIHNLRKHDETHHAMEDCGVGGWLPVRMIREVARPQSLHPSPPRDQPRVGAQQPIHSSNAHVGSSSHAYYHMRNSVIGDCIGTS